MARNIGSTTPAETHDSREIERLRKGRITTIRYNGSYSALAAMQPKPGTKRDGGTVRTSALRRLQGGMGLLEYTVAAKGGDGQEPASVDQLEIEMAQTERPITALSEYSGYADVLELWRNAPDELRTEFKFESVSNGGEVEIKSLEDDYPNAYKATRLILRGIESVLVFHPVVTLTTEHDARPSDYGRSIGKRQNPAVGGYPGGYEWLKTADRLQRNQDDTWTRVQQWTGAAEEYGGWEHDLSKEG